MREAKSCASYRVDYQTLKTNTSFSAPALPYGSAYLWL
jgi:hypothetical protein